MLRVAIIGYGNVGRALLPLLHAQRAAFPFVVTGIHTARHGTAIAPEGIDGEPRFGPALESVEKFLYESCADVAVELTPLNPATGQPALSHIRAAFARQMHVVTANKGPIAHSYSELRDEAAAARVSSASSPRSWTEPRYSI